MLVYLFGGYKRTGYVFGRPVEMSFLFLRGAVNYGRTGFSALDPYARFLTGAVVFVPGKLLRRKEWS